MRSRYSAYALKLADYIIRTTHPENNSAISDPVEWKKDIITFSQMTDFTGLKIIDFHEETNRATVTFRAILKQKLHDVSFTEKSLFLKIKGRWLYREALDLQRNQHPG